jgi:hypothetical protein
MMLTAKGLAVLTRKPASKRNGPNAWEALGVPCRNCGPCNLAANLEPVLEFYLGRLPSPQCAVAPLRAAVASARAASAEACCWGGFSRDRSCPIALVAVGLDANRSGDRE